MPKAVHGEFIRESPVEASPNGLAQFRREGSVVLLHDAGGNRSQTVAALPAIIDWLRTRGDRIVPLSELAETAAI